MKSEKNIFPDRLSSWKPNTIAPQLSSCSKAIVEDTGKIRDATTDEVYECCLRRYTSDKEYCDKNCPKRVEQISGRTDLKLEKSKKALLDQCLSNCRVMMGVSVGTCRAVTPYFTLENDYYKCADIWGCKRGLGQIPDHHCVRKNRDKILQCCKGKCVSNKVLDCSKHCKMLQRLILDPESLGLPLQEYPYAQAIQDNKPTPKLKEEKPVLQTKTQPQPKSTNIGLYIGIAIGASLILVAMLLLLKYLISNRK